MLAEAQGATRQEDLHIRCSWHSDKVL